MNASAYNPGTTGGNREDIKNVITILEPQDTPFVSRCRKGEAPKATKIETLADKLRKPRRTGTREGTDAEGGANKAKNRARFGVYIHRICEPFGVTDVQQIISERGGTAGVTNEYADAKSKTLQEIKRDMEAICLGDQEDNGGETEDEMTTRGVFKWIDSAAQTSNPVPEAYRTLSGAIVSGKSFAGTRFTEDDLNGVLKTLKGVYGGKRTYFCLGGDNAIDTVDHFTRVNSSTTNARYQVQELADEHEITMMVNIFDSSFGRCEFAGDDFIKTSATTGNPDLEALAILNMELLHLDMFDALHAVDEDETAGGKNGWAKVMFALLCDNPKGLGKIYNT